MAEFELIADGLRFPEAPVVMDDGSVIVVEIEAGRITRCWPGGRRNIDRGRDTGQARVGLRLGKHRVRATQPRVAGIDLLDALPRRVDVEGRDIGEQRRRIRIEGRGDILTSVSSGHAGLGAAWR